ncbi:MAG: hypothetical protein GWN88_26655, partial [Nitrospinaceae bacterium]|nr:hypothetical protein [Nitrospinaceae bacterium]NIW62151.1 hypothetical protein [Nitrospinaceae bacterium]
MAQRSLRENLRIIDKRFGYRGPLGRIDVSQDRQSLQEELLQVNEFELEEAASPEEDPFLKEGDFLKGAVVEVSSDKAQVLLGLGSG